MAFKMKGNPYKVGGHKTKATMAYMKSPLEQAKPDYPDIDGDGNTTESMKQAAADKKSPMEQKRKITKEGKKLAKDYKKKVIKDSKETKKSNIAVLKKAKGMGYEGAKADIKDERKRHRDTKKEVRGAYRDAKKLYKSGESPLEQTSFVDKLKSAGKAAIAGLYAKSTGPHNNIPATISKAYKKEKKAYRDADRKSKINKKD